MTPLGGPLLSVPASRASTSSFADDLGLCAAADPSWLPQVLRDEDRAWIMDRWSPGTREFEWVMTDPLVGTYVLPNRSRVVDLSGLRDSVVVELLACAAADAVAGIRANTSEFRWLAAVARDGDVSSVCDLDVEALEGVCPTGSRGGSRAASSPFRKAVGDLRRWQSRIENSGADRDREWERDRIRLAVVKPGAPKTVWDVGQIEQTWLRSMLVGVMRARISTVGHVTLSAYLRGCKMLSQHLSTRPDSGRNPRLITARDMDRFAERLAADADVSDFQQESWIKAVSSVLTQGRALGLAEDLPASFSYVEQRHAPKRSEVVFTDRAFPDAAFRLVTGCDEHFGPGVFDLARAVPGGAFNGEVFVAALHAGASFGRRASEVLNLRADRVRFAETGAADILYDNFKSGRQRVWLPIDARSATRLAEWIARLRQQYPDTPLDRLALMPAALKNPSGTRSVDKSVLGQWFRIWILQLEQAIILAHLHEAVQVDVADLCQATVGDLSDQCITVCGTAHSLPPRAWQMMVDYRADLMRRHRHHRLFKDANPDQWPLFPCHRKHFDPRNSTLTPVSPERFSPLGPDWLTVGAGYSSPGLPGQHHLGASRISADELQYARFRHTYLQHLVNVGVDVFLVAELADHSSVQTTLDAYVRVQDEKLREAVDLLTRYRQRMSTSPTADLVALPSLSLSGVTTNDCDSPQVLRLGVEACVEDRMCFDCRHLSYDPSHIEAIKTEIRTCDAALARIHAQNRAQARAAHVEVLTERRDGWRRLLERINTVLTALDPADRDRVLIAATIVRDFRGRAGGRLNLAGPAIRMGSVAP